VTPFGHKALTCIYSAGEAQKIPINKTRMKLKKFKCSNCKKTWADDPAIDVVECPYCGSSDLALVMKIEDETLQVLHLKDDEQLLRSLNLRNL